MQVITGVVTAISEAEEVRGAATGHGGPSVTYVSTFNLDKQRVQIRSNSKLKINDNHRVSVAGDPGSQHFYGVAYVNHSTGAKGNKGLLTSVLFALALPSMGGYSYLNFNPGESGQLMLAVSVCLISAGLFFAYRSIKIKRAINLLRRR